MTIIYLGQVNTPNLVHSAQVQNMDLEMRWNHMEDSIKDQVLANIR
jgi:hypothetical protein